MPRLFERHCDNCGKHYKSSAERFCSNECAKSFRRKNMKSTFEIICKQCGKEFSVLYKYRGRKFCSTECSKEHYNLNHPTRARVKKICECCGKEFTVMDCKNFRKFCSNKCKGLHYTKNKKPYTQQTKINLSSKFSSTRKRALQKGLGCETYKDFCNWYASQLRVCSYCGIPEETLEAINKDNYFLERVLTIDRKDNSKGYTKDNMVLSCRKCNIIKNDVLSHEEMLEIAQKYITPKWQKKNLEREVASV